MGDEVNLEVLEKVLDGFNRHDADGIVAFFTEDAVFETPRGTNPSGRRLEGKDEVRAGFAAGSRASRTCTTARTATSCAGIGACPSGR
jgi:ketosteroid isomerase-like protein